jgi:14-3-3 protein epsilon
VEDELKNLCMDVINLLTNTLLPNCLEMENKIFYLKMKADYYRYLAEFILEDNLQEIIDKSEFAYKEA